MVECEVNKCIVSTNKAEPSDTVSSQHELFYTDIAITHQNEVLPTIHLFLYLLPNRAL